MRRARLCLLVVICGGLGATACELTKEIRTRPGGPGTVSGPPPQLPEGGFPIPSQDAADAAFGRDGAMDGAADGPGRGGASGASGSGGGSGSTGDASAGGITGSGGRSSFNPICRMVSHPCQDYCVALPFAPTCESDIEFLEAGTNETAVAECECECEALFRNDCGTEFDELMGCASAPLMLTCVAGEDVPVVSGDCGARRFAVQTCLDEAAAAWRDAGTGGSSF